VNDDRHNQSSRRISRRSWRTVCSPEVRSSVGEFEEGRSRANHRRRRSDGARGTTTMRPISGYPRRFLRWGEFWRRGEASRTLGGARGGQKQRGGAAVMARVSREFIWGEDRESEPRRKERVSWATSWRSHPVVEQHKEVAHQAQRALHAAA
jgi:hypothetical protein